MGVPNNTCLNITGEKKSSDKYYIFDSNQVPGFKLWEVTIKKSRDKLA